MSQTSANTSQAASAAIDRAMGKASPLTTPNTGVIGDEIEAIEETPQPDQSISLAQEQAPAPMKQEEPRRITPRPTYIAQDIVSSVADQDKFQQAKMTPQQEILTPRQAREQREIKSSAQSVIDEMRDQYEKFTTQSSQNTNTLNDERVSEEETSETKEEKSNTPVAEIKQEATDNKEKINQPELQKFDSDVEQARDSSTPQQAIGVAEKPTPPKESQGFLRTRFKGIQDKLESSIKADIKSIQPGNSFNDKLLADHKVPPYCISIGTENLIEAIREPGSKIVQYVSQETGIELDPQECLNDISILMNVINDAEASGNGIEVVLDKDPINKRGMMQTRTLRVHVGSCLRIHPTQAKGYNADFDGDTGKLIVNKRYVNRYPRAMTTLVDIDGNPNIDPDFFIVPAVDRKDRQKVLDLMIQRRFSWNEEVALAIIDEYIAVSNVGSKENWLKLLRKIEEVSGRISSDARMRNRMISRILSDLYEFSNDRNDLMIREHVGSLSEEYSNFNPPSPKTDPFVIKLIDWMDEIVAGRPAPNFQQFTIFYNKFYGEADVEKKLKDPSYQTKNVPFRLVADIGKAVNRSEFVLIGRDVPITINDNIEYVTLEELYQVTCSAIESKVIASRTHMGSHKLNSATEFRDRVIEEVGLPNIKGDFKEWLNRFRDSYNYYARLYSTTKAVKFRADMRIVHEYTYDGINDTTDLGKSLLDIYGDFTVRQVFPHIGGLHYRKAESKLGARQINNDDKQAVLASYLDMPLRVFAMNNKLAFNINDIKQRRLEGGITEFDVLCLVADRRRADTQSYKTQWMKWTEKFFTLFKDLKDYGFLEKELMNDFEQHLCDMLDMLTFAGADIFEFYGMEDYQKFLNSEWGQKLLSAKSIESFRSTWVSMLIKYRLDKAMRIKAEMREYSSMIGIEESDRELVLDSLSQAQVAELDLLKSSSMAWKAIIEDTYDGNSVFKKLSNLTERESYSYNGRNIEIYAKDFWVSGAAKKYNTLYQFLVSDENYTDKINVLADIVRHRENYRHVISHEMIGQLAHNPDPVKDGSPFEMDSGLDTKPFKTSLKKISSYLSDSPRKAKRYAKKLVKHARNNRDQFEVFITTLAYEPGLLVHIDTHLASDAMATVHDKDYADTEKGKQQYRVNAYFGALSLRDGGGYYTHLQQTDNKLLNVVGYDQITVVDLVRVIGDPTITITVYDELGRPGILSRRNICGGDSIDDVINWIEANPSMAYLFRRHTVNANTDTHGSVSLGGINDAEFSLTSFGEYYSNAAQRNFDLLCDRPKFFALSALLTPVGLDTGRTLAGKHNKSINDLAKLIGYYASFENPESIVEHFSQLTGLTKEALKEASYRAKFDDGSGLDEKQVELMYREAITELLDCVGIIHAKGCIVKEFDDDINLGKDFNGIDSGSVVAYYDVRQQLSGARTNTMIGIEGSVTGRVQILHYYLARRPDRFFTVGEHIRPDEIQKLSTITGRDLFQEIEDSIYGVAVIDRNQYKELKDWDPKDFTLERSTEKQITSTAKFLEVKRENAAEAYNMKAKKFGDDGKNSIIKYSKLDIKAGNNLRRKLKNAKTRDDAIQILAQALEQADRDLGYIDVGYTFMPSDYMNRADLMLAQDENGNLVFDQNGNPVIRTMEQLAAACCSRLTIDGIEGGNETLLPELTDIVTITGTDNDSMIGDPIDVARDVVRRIRKPKITKNLKADRAILEHASAEERNYEALEEIYLDFSIWQFEKNETFKPWSRKKSEDHSRKMFYKLDDKTQEILRGIIYPSQHWDESKKEYVDNSFDDTYNYLGRPTDEDFVLQPGFQNLVLFDSELNDKTSKVLENCKRFGITALFHGVENVPQQYAEDVQEIEDGYYILPFFYMKINGATSDQIGPAPGQFPFNPTNVTVCVESTTGEIRAGDATAHATKELGERTRIVRGDIVSFTKEQLFPNVIAAYDATHDIQMDFCTREEVQKYIINGYEDATIDIGLPRSEGSRFDYEMQKMETRIEEYKARFNEANAASFLTGDMKDDRIIGFAKVIVDGHIKAFAPIIPFHREQSGSVPRSYRAVSFKRDPGSDSFVMKWKYEGGILNQAIKFFEGIGASNKMMTNGEYIQSRTLANGLPVDLMYSSKSIASRLFASNKRINTLTSLMMMPRIDSRYSYNFAELADAFPGNEKLGDTLIKDLLLSNSLTLDDWAQIREMDIVYHRDQEINALIRTWVNKCVDDYQTVNPSILLATRSADGTLWPMATEFEAFMDTSYKFQNALMHFMNAVTSVNGGTPLCPESIEADSSNTLFKPNTSSEEDYGVLQMIVPCYIDGETTYVLQNVYISFGFFGDVFSGFGRFNVNAGMSNTDLNIADTISDEDLVKLAKMGSLDISPLDRMMTGGLEVDPTSFLFERESVKKESDKQTIDSFRGEYDFLSNMYDSPVYIDIWRFDNAEAAYQAKKLYYLNNGIAEDKNWDKQHESFEHMSGKEAKSAGRKIKNLDKKRWDENKRDVMKMIIRSKFDPEFNPSMAAKLIATGDADLIEGNTWGDTYWGVSNGVGENNLGKILMEVRAELINREA